jgi:hypothetical protein
MSPSPRRRNVTRRDPLTHQHGAILIGTVLAMLLLTVLALSLAMHGALEGKVAVNHYALVKALHVADAGIDGVRKELTAYVNGLAGGWTGNWNPVLANKGNVCNGGSTVLFSFIPTGGTAWISSGSGRTLFVTDNDTSPWEDGNACTDNDGIITVVADGRVAASGGAFGAAKRVAVDLAWQLGGTAGGWDNAVQGGGPGGGALINGNAMVYGGVALKDSGGGTVWSMGGTSGIRNNYQNGAGVPSSEQLRGTTRALLNPTLLALGDVALNAGLRVEQGIVAFGGGATAGLAQGSTTGRKQTLDVALANDFEPADISAIHADRVGPAGAVLGAPLLADIVGGADTRTWEVMLNQDGMHITRTDMVSFGCSGCDQTVIDGRTGGAFDGGNRRRFCFYANMAEPAPPSGTFVPPPPACTLKTTAVGTLPSKFDLVIDLGPNPNIATLDVQGIIVFDDQTAGQGIRFGGLSGGGPDSLGTIVYRGSAVIFIDDALANNCTGATVCAGRLTIDADIVTAAASYPTAVNPPVYPPVAGTVNTIGFMADRIGIARGADDTNATGASSSPTMTGLFYAQSRVYVCKNTEIFGSLLSPQVNISCNVPKIAAVRTMSKFLPPGLIGGDSTPVPGSAVVIRWREVPRP